MSGDLSYRDYRKIVHEKAIEDHMSITVTNIYMSIYIYNITEVIYLKYKPCNLAYALNFGLPGTYLFLCRTSLGRQYQQKQAAKNNKHTHTDIYYTVHCYALQYNAG